MREGAFKIKCENIMQAQKMNLKKENGKYVFDEEPKFQKNFPLAKNEYLEIPLTKCSTKIIDKLVVYPYVANSDARKTKIEIFYLDIISNTSFRIDIKFVIESKGFFNRKNSKYWNIEVYRIDSFYEKGILTDKHGVGSLLSSKIEKIFFDNKMNRKKIIEILLKFNYTKYSKNKNLEIGGI